MTAFHIILLALVQGITEFLPISSSAHLALIPVLTGWPDQGLELDVAAHVGSLGAVLVYFHRDTRALAIGLGRCLIGRPNPSARLLGLLVIATFPTVVAGAAVYALVGGGLRQVDIIAWATLIGAGLLYAADRLGPRVRRFADIRMRTAIIVGIAQALALIPGTSRAGITMTAARMLGYERADAARLSMLMSIPVILAAGTLGGHQVLTRGDDLLTSSALIVAGLSFVSALVAIRLLMAWLQHAGFMPFVVYRVVLAGSLFWLVYG